jgi:hypothetical protein
MPRREPDWLTRAEENALAIELGRLRSIFPGQVRQNVAEAMRAARIRPVMIYAYVRTGLLVTETTRGGYSGQQLQTWESAVRDYGKARSIGSDRPEAGSGRRHRRPGE